VFQGFGEEKQVNLCWAEETGSKGGVDQKSLADEKKVYLTLQGVKGAARPRISIWRSFQQGREEEGSPSHHKCIPAEFGGFEGKGDLLFNRIAGRGGEGDPSTRCCERGVFQGKGHHRRQQDRVQGGECSEIASSEAEKEEKPYRLKGEKVTIAL